jgi:hypothetical protein
MEPRLAKLGTRNNSACLFCREHPGAWAFVVSQDGDLRVFYSDEKAAYAILAIDTIDTHMSSSIETARPSTSEHWHVSSFIIPFMLQLRRIGSSTIIEDVWRAYTV